MGCGSGKEMFDTCVSVVILSGLHLIVMQCESQWLMEIKQTVGHVSTEEKLQNSAVGLVNLFGLIVSSLTVDQACGKYS